MESHNLESHRDQFVKTFKPGNLQEVKKRNLPNAPGTNKVMLWKKNKPSKRRVKVGPGEIKAIPEINMYGDVGGDGGEQYLYDYEELKKAMNDATGSCSTPNNQFSNL